MAWNGSNGASAPQVTPRKSPASPWRGAVALLIIVALGGAAYLLVSRDALKPTKLAEKTEKSKAIAEAVPEIAKKAEVGGSDSTNRVDEGVLDESKVTIIKPRTSTTGRVMILMDGTVVTNMPRRIFDRDFEKTLSVVLRPGSMSRGLFKTMRNKYTDEQIVAMLIEPTRPNDDDPEDVRRVKNNVQDLKVAMCEQIKKGRSVSEVLDEIQDQLSREAMVRAVVRNTTREAIRSGDEDSIRTAIEAGDRLLEKKGLPLQSVAPRYRVDVHQSSEITNGEDE